MVDHRIERIEHIYSNFKNFVSMVMFVLFAWLWNVLVVSVVSVSRSLVLHGFLSVLSEVLSVSGWFGVADFGGSVLQKLVDDVFFLVSIDVHVGNG